MGCKIQQSIDSENIYAIIRPIYERINSRGILLRLDKEVGQIIGKMVKNIHAATPFG